jgi:hypothetical protein
MSTYSVDISDFIGNPEFVKGVIHEARDLGLAPGELPRHGWNGSCI